MFKIWYNTGVVNKLVNIGNPKNEEGPKIPVNQRTSIEEGLKIDSFEA